jgi:hypothetical protein
MRPVAPRELRLSHHQSEWSLMRTSPIIVVLLLAAALSATAAAFSVVPQNLSAGIAQLAAMIGLALAQTQLAAAAVVLLSHRLMLRVAALALCVLGWALALERYDPLHDAPTWAVVLLAAALATAAICAVLQTIRPPSEEFAARGPRYQFSLATLLLCMMIVCVFLGTARQAPLLPLAWLLTLGSTSMLGVVVLQLALRGAWRSLLVLSSALIVQLCLGHMGHLAPGPILIIAAAQWGCLSLFGSAGHVAGRSMSSAAPRAGSRAVNQLEICQLSRRSP